MKRLLPLMLFVCAGCSHRAPAPVPRPRAYPRTDIPSAVYRPVTFGGYTLQVNDFAEVSQPKTEWIDIGYPRLDITVSCALNRPVNIRAALANRAERMALNLNGTSAVMDRFTSRSGLYVTLLTARDVVRTPVQFIATDSAKVLLTGAAVADFNSEAKFDSVKPVIDSVSADITHMLRQL